MLDRMALKALSNCLSLSRRSQNGESLDGALMGWVYYVRGLTKARLYIQPHAKGRATDPPVEVQGQAQPPRRGWRFRDPVVTQSVAIPWPGFPGWDRRSDPC